MSFSTKGEDDVFRCDSSHPVSLPYLQLKFQWDGQFPQGDTVTLASGSGLGFHADFMNAWDQPRLDLLFNQCIKAQTECGRVGNGPPPRATPVTTAAPTTTAASHTAHTTTTMHTVAATTTSTSLRRSVTTGLPWRTPQIS
jgi:hypothetical protein